MASKLPMWSTSAVDSAWFDTMRLPSLRNRFVIIALVATLSFGFLLTSYNRTPETVVLGETDRGPDVYNRTLGFQKIFAIGFQSRMDKHDALSMASSYTNFDIEMFDAVAPEDVPKKVIPEGWNAELTPTAFASKRAHLNLLRKIIDERIQTALILEDDVDWDITIKQQLAQFATGVKTISNNQDDHDSPYGTNWDTLWLGHCRSGRDDNDTAPLYVLSDDSTVPPVGHRKSLWRQWHIIPEVMSNTTRIIYKQNAGMCTFGYAVTFEGARKILTSLSIQTDLAIYDTSMSAMCMEKHIRPFTCYSIYPPLISSHRFAGSNNRDSDLQNLSTVATHPEYTWDIVYSTIQNVPRLASGLQTVLSQWPNDTQFSERSIDEPYTVTPSVKLIEWSTLEKEYIKGINQV